MKGAHCKLCTYDTSLGSVVNVGDFFFVVKDFLHICMK